MGHTRNLAEDRCGALSSRSLLGGADRRCSPASQESFVLLSAHRHALSELPVHLRRPLAHLKYPGPSLGSALSELGQIAARGVQCDHHLGHTEEPTDLTAAGVPRPFAAVPGGRGAAPSPGAEPRRAPTHPLLDAASEPLEEIKCKTRTATNVSGYSPLASRGRDHLCLARVSSRCQGFGDMRGSD